MFDRTRARLHETTQVNSIKHQILVASGKVLGVTAMVVAIFVAGFATSQKHFQSIMIVEVPAARFSYQGHEFAQMQVPKGGTFWNVAQVANMTFGTDLVGTDIMADNPKYGEHNLPPNVPVKVRVNTVTECYSAEAEAEARALLEQHMPPIGGQRLRMAVASLFGQVPDERTQVFSAVYEAD